MSVDIDAILKMWNVGDVEEIDNPPPVSIRPRGHLSAPWHGGDDDPVSGWEPSLQALAAALDRTHCNEQWKLAFAHLRAAPRRNLAFVRASCYSKFVEVLDDLTDVELFEQEERDLLVDVFRQRMAAHETDHVPMILDVTFRSKPVADKQRNREAGKESELMDPPTRAEMFQALRLLRGLWLHSPRSCEAAGKAGAVEALLHSFIKGVPDPTEDTVAWQMARALEDWKRQVEQAEIDGTLEDIKKKAKEKKPGPPFRISCPGGFDEHGRPVGNELLFEFDFDDPEVEYGQPDEDEVRLETLEALLALLSGPDQECRRQFMKLGGVASVAEFLVPWLSENGGEDEPSELVQRCIVFVGVLIRHALPGDGDKTDRDDKDEGKQMAEQAEATLREIIGPDATEEILAAAEELYPGFDKTFGEDSPRAGVDVSELESESFAQSMMEQSLEALKASGIDTEAVEELIAGFKLNQSSEGGDGTAEEQ